MLMKLFYFFIFMTFPLILLMMNYTLHTKILLNRNSISSFECGFDNFNNARSSFSLHFFLVSVIFLIFDLEIVFLMPLPMWVAYNKLIILTSSFIFILILFIGILHEWNEGSLNWV